jgi:uncharacterized protein YdeI (YjbR/CyaY-like superfamily)
VKTAAKKPSDTEKKALLVPGDLLTVLQNNKVALENFEKFPYSHRKEYIQWINEAKTPETRAKRIATTVEWTAEGKNRNWKYK